MSGSSKLATSPVPNLTTPGTATAQASAAGAAKSTEATILIELNDAQQRQLITYARQKQSMMTTQWSMKTEMEEIDRIYMREKDWTTEQIKARLANRRGDSSKFQNVTVPVVMPQVQAALTYLTNVFLTGYPLFPVVSDPANEAQAMQLEAIIQENAITMSWAQELTMFFRDGLKYNIHALEVDWQQRTNWTIKNDVTKVNSAGASKVLWAGNVVKRMDLYNTFWDPRVRPSKIHEQGEFAGYTEIYTKVRFKKFCNDLYNKVPAAQVIAALKSQMSTGGIGTSTVSEFGYYLPIINPFPFMNKHGSMDWMAWAQGTSDNKNGNNYSEAYSVTTMYARLIPSDFNLSVPEKNTPQVWKLIIINGQVILSAERLTNVHGFLPIIFGQPIEDGLDYQTKSFASNVKEMQEVASAMINSFIASKRRLIGDRVLYDPSRVKASDINSVSPTAKIPVRPSAMGKPVGDAVYQFPFRDEQTASLVQGSTLVTNYANQINGQNPAAQGQFVKGNKTRHEYDDVMGHGNGVNQMIATSIESQVFTPMKEILKLNILQYQSAGDYQTQKGVTVAVDPTDLRKTAVQFKVSDGLVPTDKIVDSELLGQFIQQIAVPGNPLAPGFNVAPMIIYAMNTQGLDLTPFAKSPEQMQYEQAMQAWSQAAQMASKAGQEFKQPQPQPSPQLQQELQKASQTAGVGPSQTSAALQSTQGAS